ncbi:hypothetical protein LTR84_002529 [Exophiala bonariae]|uniref:BZIP domain-containing protein n=1 Tax=Exophiala bonariae TaxID=1690606 RepID=A0AAV9NDR3_9EURO|nr:hypothetical protein LTR84_002529 [Exophiala bonariae]
MADYGKTESLTQSPVIMSTVTEDPGSSPEHKLPIIPRSKTPGNTKTKEKPNEVLKERDQQAKGRAELKKRIMERRKLGLHYILKAQLRLRNMEESIKNQHLHDHELAVPLDRTVMEVTRDREIKKVEEIEEELQKHIDGIQTLCAKLKK